MEGGRSSATAFWPRRRTGGGRAACEKVNTTTPWPITMRWNFPTGRWLVTRLCDGQRATVLQLPAGSRAATAEETVVERQLRESRFRSDRADGYALIDGCNTKNHRLCR